MKKIPDNFDEGDSLTADDVNEILEVLRELQKEANANKQALRKVKTPSGGIPASGSANCTVNAWNPYTSAWANGSVTLKCWNPSSSAAVAGNTLVTVAWVSGRWEVILEPC
jgi:hypothetical protein